MKKLSILLGAAAVALSPGASLARPGGGMGQGSAMSQGHMSQPTMSTSQGSTRGAGWDHLNGPSKTGQPSVECEETRPGRASTAPGSAFNEDGRAGTRYAGEQAQNSRNTASVSQYDVACLHQPGQ
jgi:hypothetical protein